MKVWVQFDIDEEKVRDTFWVNTSVAWDTNENGDDIINEDGLVAAFVEELEQRIDHGEDMDGVSVNWGLTDTQVATRTGQQRNWRDAKARAKSGY